MSNNICIKLEDVFDIHNENYIKMMDIIKCSKIDDKFYEKHHIIPRFVYKMNNFDVDNSESNLVKLSFKDHFLVHYYASLSCLPKYSYGFHRATTKMLGTFTRNDCKDKLNEIADKINEIKLRLKSIPYPENARIKNIIASSGENNPFYGKKHTKESIEKMRLSKIGKKHTEETKKKLSEVHKGIKPWNSKPHEGKLNCGNYKLRGKSMDKDWYDKIKDGIKNSKRSAKNLSKNYKEYKNNGGILTWNDYQKCVKNGEICI